MKASEIKPGHCYWYSLAHLPARRLLVEHACPIGIPDLFCCWDIDVGNVFILTAEDFIRPCDDEVQWWELDRLGPEHGLALQSPFNNECGASSNKDAQSV